MQITRAQLTGLILAGGQGRRVDGADKGLLTYKNEILIETQIKKLTPQVSRILISANRNLADYRDFEQTVLADELPRQLDHKNISVKAVTQFKGPLAGVLQGLKHMQTQWLYVQPVDTPILPSHLVDSAIKAIATALDSPAYYLASNERSHYLHLFLNRSVKSNLELFIKAGKARVKEFIDSVNGQKITLDIPESMFKNLNYPEDFA